MVGNKTDDDGKVAVVWGIGGEVYSMYCVRQKFEDKGSSTNQFSFRSKIELAGKNGREAAVRYRN